MKNLIYNVKAVSFVFFIIVFFMGSGEGASGNGFDDFYSDDYYLDTEVEEKGLSTREEERVGPNPQRLYCKRLWNKYYSEKGVDIQVSTRGKYDEIVVFRCPDCSLEKHFVNPFLEGEKDGMTGMERIRACGYTKAVFIGTRGISEIERDVTIDE